MTQDRAGAGTDGAAPANEPAESRAPGEPGVSNGASAADPEAQPQLQDEALEALRAEAAQSHDRYLRAIAELDNVRKRAARDVESARRYALERFATELLPVRDSLEAGIAAAGESGAEAAALLEGAAATLRLFDRVLGQFGISEIDPHGEPFDPNQHEALNMQPSADVEPDSVLTVIQKGFQLNDRLLRPARVVVSSGPPDETPR